MIKALLFDNSVLPIFTIGIEVPLMCSCSTESLNFLLVVLVLLASTLLVAA
ncbi:hypothetical protein AM1_5849 [Acaryochloris marina MBIC11017]|uniref:Uncharacterized protein n=1 Tax=Acaryochloris marina (strain MBIC 11017) TaxID=329726 RepID=B0C0J7_ACAM1|nr:hypothetical protein AM1_5849 [Acaryochloris marina MBIC11017]